LRFWFFGFSSAREAQAGKIFTAGSMSNTTKHPLPKVASFEILLAACHKTRRGKRFRREVDCFSYKLERGML
jgi:hypothetical protein